MIRVRINGKDREIDQPTSVGALLDHLGVDRRIVAVELNGDILSRDQLDERRVEPDAVIEIVRMIGGGSEAALDECLFCRIVAGSIPATRVYESDLVIAFRDIQPAAPVHVVIIPRRHLASARDLDSASGPTLAAIHEAAKAIAQAEGIAESGFRLVTNAGPDSGQTVFHLHYHLLGGGRLGGFGAHRP